MHVLRYPEEIKKVRQCDGCGEALVWVCVWRDNETVGHFDCLRELENGGTEQGSYPMDTAKYMRDLEDEGEDVEVVMRWATPRDRVLWLRTCWRHWRESDDPEVRAVVLRAFWQIFRYCLKPNAQAVWWRKS